MVLFSEEQARMMAQDNPELYRERAFGLQREVLNRLSGEGSEAEKEACIMAYIEAGFSELFREIVYGEHKGEIDLMLRAGKNDMAAAQISDWVRVRIKEMLH